jgi:meso-butanediol dehydrogenase/(S,S)-butanediol dehydrogenase/diacetyl reductase
MSPNDVVLVVGTGGMGMACARRLGAGRRLVIADNSAERLAQAARALRDEGHDARAELVDVSHRESVRALAKAAAGSGRIAAIVHTAGISPAMASAELIYRVDLLGTAYAIEEFCEVATGGTCLVCIASMGAYRAVLPADVAEQLARTPADRLPDVVATLAGHGDPRTAYHVSKRANQLRVQAAAGCWGRRGARLNTVSPGIIATPMSAHELDGPHSQEMRELVGRSAARRMGTADDVAAAVAFLVSPEASFITGTDLLVDGGAVPALTWP